MALGGSERSVLGHDLVVEGRRRLLCVEDCLLELWKIESGQLGYETPRRSAAEAGAQQSRSEGRTSLILVSRRCSLAARLMSVSPPLRLSTFSLK